MKEIERRRGMLGHLHATRDQLTGQLEAVNAEIAEIESIAGQHPAPVHRGPGRPKGSGKRRGPAPGPGRGRGGNEQSLTALLHSLLQGKTMSVPEMAAAAKQAGHKSKSKNFRTIVSLAIIKHRNMFKRVSRGQYTAK
jgi:hypothetical protein